MILVLILSLILLIIIVDGIIIYASQKSIPLELIAILSTIIIAVMGYVATAIINAKQAKDELHAQKNLLIWQDRKALAFEFVEFLDRSFFLNEKVASKNISTEEHQKAMDEFARGFNEYYGKLYLIMDTELIESLNKWGEAPITLINRYQILKEIRGQMLRYINDTNDTITEKDFPYISIPVNEIPLSLDGKAITTLEELRLVYPNIYIQQGEAINTYRGLPKVRVEY